VIYFSIVIPLFNKSCHIVKALNSIKNQTCQQYEVLIVNDGSTDDSINVVQAWIDSLEESNRKKFQIINQKNQGVSVARNTGIMTAKNEYIAFLDADDYWEINHLTHFVYLIEKFASKVDLFSNASKQYQNNAFIYPNLANYTDFIGILDFFKVSTISHGFVHTSSVCVKKSAILDNLFPLGMKNFEDVITWARLANSKGFAFSSEATSVYVIENIEASASVDFDNYIKFEQLLYKIPYDRSGLKKYMKRTFLLTLLAARIRMSYVEYFQQVMKVLTKSQVVTMYSLIALSIPKIILRFIRDKRKQYTRVHT
jgi:glycosyltransferase involved in cell wall biosynthesis